MDNENIEKSKMLEELAVLYIAAKEEVDSAKIKMETRKMAIEKLMADEEDATIFIRYDDDYDIKVERKVRSTKKFDKELLAENLDVSEDVIKQDFIVKSVEDDKLTYEQYKGYFFQNHEEGVTIRKVKGKTGAKNK